MWQPQWPLVEDTEWRVLAPDLRGYGRTSVVPGAAGAAAALRGRAERPSYEPVLAQLAVPAVIGAGDPDAFATRLPD